ncbi:MAG: hypothetical protein JSU87_11435 [Gemmatimonadota bacterium]|nr:MAG: hypothetical protein JSU87_11435 [Gemmatimonadota bacterium]
MKYFPALLMTVLAAGLAACGGGVQLPAVAPEQVEIFMPGSLPLEEYETLATIQEQGPLGIADQELIDRARARAAERGADALLILEIRQTTEGAVEMNLAQEQLKILEGRAIYYPAKHPELNQ